MALGVTAANSARLAQARIDLLRGALASRPESHQLLFQLAEAFAGAGDDALFARTFRQAFVLNPSIRPRLEDDKAIALAVRAGKLRARARALVAHGVVYPPVIAALAVGEGLLGNSCEVERLVDYQRFFSCRTIHPAGEAGDAAFRAELALELASNSTYRDKQKGKAGAGWYRFDVLDGPSPACRRLAAEIRRQVDGYIAALPPLPDHPFVSSRPAQFHLRGWSVASDGEDHFASHIHPQSWLSGVYYVTQPEVPRGSARGWLRAGPPAQFGLSTADGWAERLVEPRPGRLCLMPGYFYHETLPTHSDQKRICVAFNVVPQELGAARAADY